MTIDELCTHYSRLRGDLDQAYASPVWDSARIDRLADQIADAESALSARAGQGRTFAARSVVPIFAAQPDRRALAARHS